MIEIRCRKCDKLLVKKEPNELLSIKCNRCGDLTPLMMDVNNKQMIVTDKNGMILYVNESVMNASGYNIVEILGSKVSQLWGRNMGDQYFRGKREEISNKRGPIHVTLDCINKSGDLYKTSVYISPVFGHDGEVLFYISIGETV